MFFFFFFFFLIDVGGGGAVVGEGAIVREFFKIIIQM